jgi:acyl dehydratase
MSGPYFEDLHAGAEFHAPAVTIDHGMQAVHRSILADRMPLSLDDELAYAVTGRRGLAHPALVWNLAIGQSSVVTRHVVANLFYRDLRLGTPVATGDTLNTTTTVLATRMATVREGRPRRGLVALRIRTVDQRGGTVLDFGRCALLPLRDQTGSAEPSGPPELLETPAADGTAQLPDWAVDWSIDAVRHLDDGADLRPGLELVAPVGDVVSSAPELARLTLNVAAVHHDQEAAGGQRLVYGGHTIGLALSQVCRLLPGLIAVTEWFSCAHTGPVHEGDTIRSRVLIEDVQPQPNGGRLAALRVVVTAAPDRPVLDWRFGALIA